MILELQATPEEVMRAVETWQEFAQARHVPEKIIFGLALALEECGSNIVNHALQRDPARKFRVEMAQRGDAFVVELRDRGPAFDPTAAPQRERAAEADEPGGWGIELARRYTDEIRYERRGEENILCLVKRLEVREK